MTNSKFKLTTVMLDNGAAFNVLSPRQSIIDAVENLGPKLFHTQVISLLDKSVLMASFRVNAISFIGDEIDYEGPTSSDLPIKDEGPSGDVKITTDKAEVVL